MKNTKIKIIALFLGILFFPVFASAIQPNILDYDCRVVTGWPESDTDTGVSQINPAGQLELATNLGAAGDATAWRRKTIISPPNQFTITVRTYCDSVGSVWNDGLEVRYTTATWAFVTNFRSNGLFITKTGSTSIEVGTDIVLCNASAAWQTWRFQVDKTAGEASATVEVFLEEVSQGTVDCDFEVSGTDGRVTLRQYGSITDNMLTHIDSIKIGTGLGAFTPNPPQIQIF
jgi:hypothetical protein